MNAFLQTILYVSLTVSPYTELAREAVRDWNKNGCVELKEAKGERADTILLSPHLRRTSWSGTMLRMPPIAHDDPPIYHVEINATTLEAFGEFWQRSALCHELGHRLGVGHSEDPKSCMTWTWTSDRPTRKDLAEVRDACAMGGVIAVIEGPIIEAP